MCFKPYIMSNDYYSQVFDAVNTAILVVDEAGCIIDVNATFLKLFPKTVQSKKHFIGGNCVTHSDLKANKLCEVYQKLLKENVKEIPNVAIPQSESAGNSCFDIHIHPSETTLDSVVTNVYFLIHDDVTNLVVANESATRAKDMLDEIQEVSGFGWWDLDIPNQTAVWSKQLFYILGYTPGVDEATSANFIARIHPEDKEKALSALEKPFEDGEPYESEFRLLQPDGKVRHISEHGRVIFDEQRKGLRYLGTSLDITRRVEAQKKLSNSERELRKILEKMQDTYYRTDVSGCLERVSPSVERLIGYRPDEVIGMEITGFYVDPDERERLFKELQDNKGVVHGFEAPLKHKDGSHVWVSMNAHMLSDDDGNFIGIEGTTRNITDKKANEMQMQKLSQALEQSADSVGITNARGEYEYINPAFEHTTGYSYEEAVGKKASILKSGKLKPDFYNRLWGSITQGIAFSDLFINRKKDGTLFHEQKTITPLKNEKGEITHYVSTGRDITDFIQSQEHVNFLAHHDALTGLPNRLLFQQRLEHAVVRAKRHESVLTILFLDLDRFKVINDTLGHHFGDLLLKEVSTRLLNCVREEDTIARLGGDEFAILIESAVHLSDISTLANKLLDTVALPFNIQDREMHVSTSIGISTFPHDGEQPDTLLSNADVAMYKAKETGRNNYTFYSHELSEKVHDRVKIENALRQALNKDEFCIFYQPQMNVHNNKVVGMEALLRWQNPEFGTVMPTDFIFLLEEIGLIRTVGEWVIEKSCQQLKAWHDFGFTDLSMSINLSSRQFNDSSIVDIVQQTISVNQLDPQLIDLEITESLLMRNVKSVDDILDDLSELGVNIAIDDFGTGYSSLSYLKRFPINILKIDRSFIKDIVFDDEYSGDIEIVKAIIAMGKVLNMMTIAEGVESEEQQVFLTENGCDLIQGYKLSKPLCVEHMSEWLSMHYLHKEKNI